MASLVRQALRLHWMLVYEPNVDALNLKPMPVSELGGQSGCRRSYMILKIFHCIAAVWNSPPNPD